MNWNKLEYDIREKEQGCGKKCIKNKLLCSEQSH